MPTAPQPTEISIEYLITKEFHTTEAFSQHIEREANKRNFSVMEALLEYCEQKDIESTAIAKMITPSLKQKIQADAETLHLIKKTTGTLSL